MAAPAPTKNVKFLIVGGSFSTTPAYEPLRDLLRSHGYEADIIQTLSANDGTRQPPATTDEDAAHIRAAVLAALDDPSQPRDVVLMAHSYGGVPVSSSLRGLSRADRGPAATAVRGVAFVAAFVLPEGASLRGYMNEAGALDAIGDEVRLGVPGGYMPKFDPALAPMMFPDVPGEQGTRLMELMTSHSSASFDGPVTYEAWMDIPSVLVIPENDITIRTVLMEKMFADAVAKGGKITRVLVEGAGHAVPFAKPDVAVNVLLKLAENP